MLHALLHVLGIDTQQSYFYDFFSGVGSQWPIALGAGTWYHKHNCHRQRCWRIGKHLHEGTPWCARHHPLPIRALSVPSPRREVARPRA